MQLKEFSREGFLYDLAGCKGIIANSGYSLISEALFLHKPYLAVPIAKQFEQIINAIYIEKLGYGLHAEEFSKKQVIDFLGQLKKYEEKLATLI